MLFVIDVGNTNTVLGLYRQTHLVQHWRVRTAQDATEDELHVLVASLFATCGVRLDQVRRTIISCVVPPMASGLDSFCRKYCNHAPIWVDARLAARMPIRYRNPEDVGADRIVNAVAALNRYRGPLIVIDFGTATTFDAISAAGEYLGGAISPGITVAAEALLRQASKLPRVDFLSPPATVIGTDTAGSIKSGVIFGYAALVDGMVERMQSEMGGGATVVATGGLAPLMKGVSRSIEAVAPHLTLEGLRLLCPPENG